MWYEDVIYSLDKDQIYTRKQIYEALLNRKPELTYNSFKWIISKMVSDGVISRKQRGEYVLRNNPNFRKITYRPLKNENIQEISKKIEGKFPYVDFICFASVQLNEFLNHLIGRNTYFILAEKGAVDFVFRYLQEDTSWNVLLKPSEKEWDAYCNGDNLVVLNLISESPKAVDEYHEMSLEQLLVDLIAEKSFRYLYSKSELPSIFEQAEKSYLIDYAKLLRYARRRGKAEEIKKYIGGYVSAYQG